MASVYMMDGQITANVNWASSDDTVATVSRTGLVTGIKEGLVTIMARSAVDSSRFGTCVLMVSTCTACSIPAGLVDRVDAGGVVTEAEKNAIAGQVSKYNLTVDAAADRSYVLNEKGTTPEREPMAENTQMLHFESRFPAVVIAPKTAWLSVYMTVNSSMKVKSDGHADGPNGDTLSPSGPWDDADFDIPGRVLFYAWDGSWAKDISTRSGQRLFIDDLPIGTGLIGRAVVQRNGFIREMWTKPFVMTPNRKPASGNNNVIPQLDFVIRVGEFW